jgi:hypothetical protein
LKIGNGSTADFLASPEPMIIREAKISPQTMFAMDLIGSGFSCASSDAELPTARGLRKTKMTKRGLGSSTAIFTIVQGTSRFYGFFCQLKI